MVPIFFDRPSYLLFFPCELGASVDLKEMCTDGHNSHKLIYLRCRCELASQKMICSRLGHCSLRRSSSRKKSQTLGRQHNLFVFKSSSLANLAKHLSGLI